MSQKIMKLFHYLKSDLGVSGSRTSTEKSRSSSDKSCFDTTTVPQPSFAGNSRHTIISSPKRTGPPNPPRSIPPHVVKSPCLSTITRIADQQHSALRDSKILVSNTTTHHFPQKSHMTNIRADHSFTFTVTDSKPVEALGLKKADLTVVIADNATNERIAPSTPVTGSSTRFDDAQGKSIFRDAENDLHPYASGYLQTKLREKCLREKPMNERSDEKVFHCRRTVILSKTQKYSTSYGLHNSSPLGKGIRRNGLSYGKQKVRPAGITQRQDATRVSPSATKLAPLYDIIASLEQDYAKEIAALSQTECIDDSSHIPIERSRRMGARVTACSQPRNTLSAVSKLLLEHSPNHGNTDSAINHAHSTSHDDHRAELSRTHPRGVNSRLSRYTGFICDDDGRPIRSLNWI